MTVWHYLRSACQNQDESLPVIPAQIWGPSSGRFRARSPISDQLASENLHAQEIAERLAAADDTVTIPLHQNLGRSTSGIVIRCLRHPIRARRPYRQHVARLYRSQRPIAQKTVPRFTNRADDIRALLGKMKLALAHDSRDGMDGAVQRWPHQVVHRR